MTDTFEITPRNRVKRSHQRARYDKEAVFGIVDSSPMCHVGYAIDGQPYVTPTLAWREGETVFWHGSSASRMLRAVRGGIPVCLTFTHFDGLVLARSAFHHSANYRVAMLFGRAAPLTDAAAKDAALAVMMEGLTPGRIARLRPNTAQELKATTVVAMDIEDAVAKIRSGPPIDDDEDIRDADCWVGVLPRREVWGTPEPERNIAHDAPKLGEQICRT